MIDFDLGETFRVLTRAGGLMRVARDALRGKGVRIESFENQIGAVDRESERVRKALLE